MRAVGERVRGVRHALRPDRAAEHRGIVSAVRAAGVGGEGGARERCGDF